MEAEIEDFLEGLQSAHLARHADRWGAGAGLVKPERLERSITSILR